MSTMTLAAPRSRNRLLLAIPAPDLGSILPLAEPVTLRQRQLLTEPNWPIQHVYFIDSGSVCQFSRGSDPIEIAMVGPSGMIGLALVLGTDNAIFRSVVQLPTRALRLTAKDFRSAMAQNAGLRAVLLKYVQFRLIVEAQAVFCNTKHKLEHRLARWLLKAHDCADSDKILASHELLSRMLGVRRAGITTALGVMERLGIVRQSRCCIEILDREQLTKNACSCYRFAQDEFQRLMPEASKACLDEDRPGRRAKGAALWPMHPLGAQ